MIDLETWLPQIVTTCELVASSDAFTRTWLEGNRVITSIIDFEELYEQIFGDLDSDACLVKFGKTIDDETCEAVSVFLASLRVVDAKREADSELRDHPVLLLKSEEWRNASQAARAVISLPQVAMHRSGRADIQI